MCVGVWKVMWGVQQLVIMLVWLFNPAFTQPALLTLQALLHSLLWLFFPSFFMLFFEFITRLQRCHASRVAAASVTTPHPHALHQKAERRHAELTRASRLELLVWLPLFFLASRECRHFGSSWKQTGTSLLCAGRIPPPPRHTSVIWGPCRN